MYQSNELAIFMKNEVESEELKTKLKEERIKNLIKTLSCRQFTILSKTQLMLIMIFSLVCAIVLLGSPYYSSNELLKGFIIAPFGLFFIIAAWAIESLRQYDSNYIGNQIKNLFLELSEKPYEIRTTVEEGTKIKILIEANQYLNDNSFIIKEKSQHITAYLELKAPYANIVKSVVDLVQKTEDKFSKL